MTPSKPEQNPYRCGDGACVLTVPGAEKGQGTNGGCRCIPGPRYGLSPSDGARVRCGIRWLAARVKP